ncbi:GNAT family N-acetyltransferase [Ruania alba]|uniref:Acetyltransferase (GNAT) family protein n=1 Tax=Ruania alba TaxID=648782 RepID=A0A1H5KKV6_9MICO|nr:GNAT family N-acetyltransferase [Ruania alba]SEE65057.1 Acetyltransferase (GNAT) family protein [Ruania alba]
MSETAGVSIEVNAPLTDAEVNALHAACFDHPVGATPWNANLARHSIAWVTARRGAALVGFVNVIGDGGVHAFLLDTSVDGRERGRGIGRRLVLAAAEEARRLGCEWLHADYDAGLVPFYEKSCGMAHTEAGLLRLH